MTPWEAFCESFYAETGVPPSKAPVSVLNLFFLTHHVDGKVVDAGHINQMSRNASAALCIISATLCHLDPTHTIGVEDVNQCLAHHIERWHETIGPVDETAKRNSTVVLAWKKGN